MAPVSAPRDIYAQGIDFAALALQYPSFAKKLKHNKQLDFSDPESVRQLTKSLLQRDFNLTLVVPEDRLCPPVPNRLNYVIWTQDLLDSTADDFRDSFDPGREVLGLDIGTGASAIYPLLACRQRPEWKFLVTETDPKSAKYAQCNIVANSLQNRIKMISVMAEGPLLPLSQLLPFDRHVLSHSLYAGASSTDFVDSVDFVMMNPPFYASEAEMLNSAKKKQRPPFSACTGGPMEMITPGGEVQFISQLLAESMGDEIKQKIQWFTSMLGKLSSVSTVVEKLREQGCTNYAVTEFLQGQKTRRWGIAWSWQDLRPSTAVARGIPGFEKKLLPFPAGFTFDVLESKLEDVSGRLNELLQGLDLQFRWKVALAAGVGLASGDVWSRKARRREARQEDGDETMMDTSNKSEDDQPALVFKVVVTEEDHQPNGLGVVTVHVRWLQGQDSVLFESLCGWLKRKIKGN